MQEPFPPPPLKETDAWTGVSVHSTYLWTIAATQRGAGNTRLLQKDTQTEQEQLQDKTKINMRPFNVQHRKPHLKFSAGRDGVKVFPCVKRGWLAGTVLAGRALFWSVERG